MDVVIHELKDVFVVGCDHHLGTGIPRSDGIGGDEIIGFGIREFNALCAEKADVFLEPLLLRAQVVRHGGAVLLVGRLEFHASRGQAGIPYHGGAVGFHIGQHFAEGFDETVYGIRRLPTGIFQSPDGEKRAVEIIVAVNEKQAHRCGLSLACDSSDLHRLNLDAVLLKPGDGFFDLLALAIELKRNQADLIRDAGLPDVCDDFKLSRQLPKNGTGDEACRKHEPEACLLHASSVATPPQTRHHYDADKNLRVILPLLHFSGQPSEAMAFFNIAPHANHTNL